MSMPLPLFSCTLAKEWGRPSRILPRVLLLSSDSLVRGVLSGFPFSVYLMAPRRGLCTTYGSAWSFIVLKAKVVFRRPYIIIGSCVYCILYRSWLPLMLLSMEGGSCRVRTCGLRVKSPSLYLTKLMTPSISIPSVMIPV